MHAARGDRVEVCSKGCNESLALTGLHLGDIAEVQCRATHELHVEVTHAQRTDGRLANCGERLRKQVIQCFTGDVTLTELDRLILQFFVGEFREVVFQLVDRVRITLKATEGAPFAETKNSFKNIGHRKLPLRSLGCARHACARRALQLTTKPNPRPLSPAHQSATLAA